jgi:S-DNA-T family DNA segregation ATPase FtsK/SpoIIIE
VVVERLRPAASRVHQVWLPPLRERFSLAEVTGPLRSDPQRGLSADGERGSLRVPIGYVDRPQDQRVDVLRVDLAVGEGNLAVVGAPQTGKSTVLRSLVLGATVTHTPRELSFYAIDFGGALAPLSGLPHVGAVAGRADSERAGRILGELSALIAAREALFHDERIDSIGVLRRRFAEGRQHGQSAADIVLLLDNWGAIRTELPEAEEVVTDIAARGLAYGIHVVVTAGRWTEIRPALQNALRGRLELRINDPFESRVDRKAQDRISAAPPGRGLTADKLIFQTALPRLDESDDIADLGGALEEGVSAVAAAWTSPPAPPIRVLPTTVTLADLQRTGEMGDRDVVLGMSGADLSPVRVDLFGPDPHFVIFGDSQSGKTSTLRTLLRGLVASRPPSELLIALIDYRRVLLDVVPEEYLLAYVGSINDAADVMTDVAKAMEQRLPGQDVGVEQLRTRSWWKGPETVIVVDDYDLVATRRGDPLEPLADLLPIARDIGLHLVLGRRVSGMARSFQPVLQRLLEIGTPGLVLSGDRGEGAVLNGVAARAQPPGRGVLAVRGRPPELVQVAWTDEPGQQ